MNTELAQGGPATVDAAMIVAWCKAYLAQVLNFSEAELDEHAELDSLGLDSAITTSMLLDLEVYVGQEIPPSVIFENTTLAELAADVVRRLPQRHAA